MNFWRRNASSWASVYLDCFPNGIRNPIYAGLPYRCVVHLYSLSGATKLSIQHFEAICIAVFRFCVESVAWISPIFVFLILEYCSLAQIVCCFQLFKMMSWQLISLVIFVCLNKRRPVIKSKRTSTNSLKSFVWALMVKMLMRFWLSLDCGFIVWFLIISCFTSTTLLVSITITFMLLSLA